MPNGPTLTNRTPRTKKARHTGGRRLPFAAEWFALVPVIALVTWVMTIGALSQPPAQANPVSAPIALSPAHTSAVDVAASGAAADTGSQTAGSNVAPSDAAAGAATEGSAGSRPTDAGTQGATSGAGATAPALAGSVSTPIGDQVSPEWIATTAASAGIPERAVRAYAGATLVLARERPGCHLGWTTLAAIGYIETGHGTHGGTRLGEAGYPETPIRGPALDGRGVGQITDSDGGQWDGDPVWDRAVGPMQFIPQTWARWGADGNGDGQADPNQIDDAALAAGRYLCHSNTLNTVEGWRAAVFSYNHSDKYVDDIANVANSYSARVR